MICNEYSLNFLHTLNCEKGLLAKSELAGVRPVSFLLYTYGLGWIIFTDTILIIFKREYLFFPIFVGEEPFGGKL